MNLMTLGGLALAVGILVDDATVEIENIERNRLLGKELRQAILDGAQEIAVPAFVSTLCICIVFVPMFFLSGVTRFLFVPLAEAVIFAMLASYLLSRTLVPTMVMFLMRNTLERPPATAVRPLPPALRGRLRALAGQLPERAWGRHAPRTLVRRGISRAVPEFGGLRVRSGPGSVSASRCRPDAPAHPRAHRPTHRRDGAPDRTNRKLHQGDDSARRPRHRARQYRPAIQRPEPVV